MNRIPLWRPSCLLSVTTITVLGNGLFVRAEPLALDSQEASALLIENFSSRLPIVCFPDGSFRPEQSVTRAEFAAMLQKNYQSQSGAAVATARLTNYISIGGDTDTNLRS